MLKKSLLALGLAATSALGLAGTAHAQVVGPDDYFDVDDVTTSRPNPNPGETITVRGTGCEGDSVDIFIDGNEVASDVPIGADGTFAVDIVAPTAAGTHTITSVCGTTTIRVGSSDTPRALPRTGDSSTTPLTRIAVGAIAGGGLLLAASRRRRPVDAA